MTTLLLGCLAVCLVACTLFSAFLARQLHRIDINVGIALDLLRKRK